jgi:hypothetical protein
LASNCIRHTDSDFDLGINLTDDEIESRRLTAKRETQLWMPAPTDSCGRGLQIIDMFATQWGDDGKAGKGKTVWFSVALQAAPAV